jgi:hypothetical protein
MSLPGTREYLNRIHGCYQRAAGFMKAAFHFNGGAIAGRRCQ